MAIPSVTIDGIDYFLTQPYMNDMLETYIPEGGQLPVAICRYVFVGKDNYNSVYKRRDFTIQTNTSNCGVLHIHCWAGETAIDQAIKLAQFCGYSVIIATLSEDQYNDEYEGYKTFEYMEKRSDVTKIGEFHNNRSGNNCYIFQIDVPALDCDDEDDYYDEDE